MDEALATLATVVFACFLVGMIVALFVLMLDTLGSPLDVLYRWMFPVKPVIEQVPCHHFEVGDLAILRDINPFKGSLKCGKTYRVTGVYPLHIALEGTGGKGEAHGCFHAKHFEKLGYDPDPPAAREYDEIMRIQELMDGVHD